MNKKRFLAAIIALTVVATILSNFGKNAKSQEQISVGMIIGSGSIYDKSFNQGIWEGIERAAQAFNLPSRYIIPFEKTESYYIEAIDELVDLGFNLIITPGFSFQNTIFEAQEKYKYTKFVLLDGVPTKKEAGTEKIKIADNTVSIIFSEHEAGFLVAVAAALQLQEGDLGFIGGEQIPSVQRFNWGFQQGIKYSNENFRTNIMLKPENIVYQGSFTNPAAGQQLASRMYNRGVKAIFCAAGLVGIGAIEEAKIRAGAGREAWIIGVDVDQYNAGIYMDNKSVILTSAIKNVGNATYDIIKETVTSKFPGGKVLIYDVNNNGVGIPEKNPNLSEDTIKKVKEIYEKIKSGDIKISPEKDGPIQENCHRSAWPGIWGC
jgi:basic membrane protein A